MSDRDAVFRPQFREDLAYWVETDRKIALRAFKLIEATMRDPFVLIFVLTQMDWAYLVSSLQEFVLDKAHEVSDLPLHTFVDTTNPDRLLIRLQLKGKDALLRKCTGAFHSQPKLI